MARAVVPVTPRELDRRMVELSIRYRSADRRHGGQPRPRVRQRQACLSSSTGARSGQQTALAVVAALMLCLAVLIPPFVLRRQSRKT